MLIEAFAIWPTKGQATLAIAGSNLTGVDKLNLMLKVAFPRVSSVIWPSPPSYVETSVLGFTPIVQTSFSNSIIKRAQEPDQKWHLQPTHRTCGRRGAWPNHLLSLPPCERGHDTCQVVGVVAHPSLIIFLGIDLPSRLPSSDRPWAPASPRSDHGPSGQSRARGGRRRRAGGAAVAQRHGVPGASGGINLSEQPAVGP